MNKKIKIILADDHRLFTSGIQEIFKSVADMEIIGTAINGKILLRMLTHIQPDLILMDINMPELDGVEATRTIKKEYPHIKVMILSMFSNSVFVRNTFRAGADGYLLKEAHKNEIFQAIKEVMMGKKYKSPSIQTPIAASSSVVLSKKEIQVLKLLSQGYTGKEISHQLGRQIDTIKTHTKNMLAKSGSKNSVELVAWAIKQGVI